MTSPTLLHLQTSVFYTENPLYRMDIANNRFPFLSMRRASSTWGTTPSTFLIPAAMQRRMAAYQERKPKGDELLLIVSGGSDLTKFRGSFTV